MARYGASICRRAGAGDDNHRRDHWFITMLADLGADAAESGGTASDDRRFFHAPDIVHSYDEFGDFDGVLIQSGNREDPNESLVENALFYIKDRQIATGSATVRAENTVRNPAGRVHYTDLLDQTTLYPGYGGCWCVARTTTVLPVAIAA